MRCCMSGALKAWVAHGEMSVDSIIACMYVNLQSVKHRQELSEVFRGIAEEDDGVIIAEPFLAGSSPFSGRKTEHEHVLERGRIACKQESMHLHVRIRSDHFPDSLARTNGFCRRLIVHGRRPACRLL